MKTEINKTKYLERNISIFSKHLHWLNWEHMAEAAKNIGFDGIDLTVRPDGHILPERVEDDLPKVYEICEKVGLRIEMLCTNIIDSSDPVTEKILKTANLLCIKNYRMGWYFYDVNISLSDNLKIFTSKMKDLATINEHYKVIGNYQNHDGNNWFGAPLWDLAIVLREINSEWLGSQFDILNATIEASKSWEIGLELIAPYIYTIDIKDAIWSFENTKLNLIYVPLGKGMVNFSRFMNHLNRLNINVPFSLHMEYNLGGAEHGSNKLKVPSYYILDSIKSDLTELKRLFLPIEG